jgi:hypothetical protein
MIQPSRRGFITGGIVGPIAAPAIVRSTSLMPVKLVDLTPQYHEITYSAGAVRAGGVDLAAIREMLLPGLKEVMYRQTDPLKWWSEQ